MAKKQFTPDRNDIIWLDFEPTRGREIGKYRPAYVLSSKGYNLSTGLLICCPISTSIRGGMTEVPLDCLEEKSVIAASLIQTLSWTDRKAKLIAHSNDETLKAILSRIVPLIGGEILFSI